MMSSDKEFECLICGGKATALPSATLAVGGFGDYPWTCRTCGQVSCEEELFQSGIKQMDPKDRAMLATFVLERKLSGRKTFLIRDIGHLTEPRPDVVALPGVLEEMQPFFEFRNPQLSLDRALLNIHRLTKKPGDSVTLPHLAAIYAEDEGVAVFVLTSLMAKNCIKAVMATDVVKSSINLTIDGWNRVAALLSERRGLESDQGFVAMWFDPSMHEAYERGIKPAIAGAGYRPQRVDQNTTPGKVCEEIIAEIRKSRFLVADFTGHREGVYFEAGFAMGLGIPVIWTVRKDSINDLHFDTRQYRHIVWETPENLQRLLQVSIEANIPKAPHKK